MLSMGKFCFPRGKGNLDSNPSFATSHPVTLGQQLDPPKLFYLENENQNDPYLLRLSRGAE